MRRVVGFTITTVAALAALAVPASACDAPHHQGDWACVYSTEADAGYCQQNPVPTVDAPTEAEVLPDVPELAPTVREHVVPLIPGQRF